MNFADSDACRRCRAMFADAPAVEPEPAVEPPEKRGVGRRLVWLALVIVAVIFGWSRSLLLTSDAIDAEQQQTVLRAVGVLQQAGFSREVLVLRHFANYRSTDNWWNVYLGHSDAYAATNFPLGVVTLYEPFFTKAVDDTERAVILLHEAQHLWGAGEEAALEIVWHEKRRLGWTMDNYKDTRVWKNTRDWTASGVPTLFHCGANLNGDCTP